MSVTPPPIQPVDEDRLDDDAVDPLCERHTQFQVSERLDQSPSDSESDWSDAYSNGSDADEGSIGWSEEDSDEDLLAVGAVPDQLPVGFIRNPYPNDDTIKLHGRNGVDGNGDGIPTWKNIPPIGSRRRAWNHWKQRPGGLGARIGIERVLESTKSPADLFLLNLTDVIPEETVKWTNQRGITKTTEWNLANPTRLKEWIPVDIIEIRAFIGLLLLAGVQKGRKEPTDELWTSNEKYKRHAFTATMGRNRFKTIMQNLRFDDKDTRAERKAEDKLAAFRTCMDSMVNNLKEIYEPTEYLTVDEQLIKFRGRCGFRVYMKSKPGKYGIKVWACVDAKTGFVTNMQVYTGKIGNQPETQQGKRVLMDMITPFLNSGRSVTADNFFGSVEAAEECLDKKTTFVCTMRKDRKEIPTTLRDVRGRNEKSSEFWWTGNCTLVSYVPKKNRSVLVMSTQHFEPLISTDDHKKPEIILHYNASKGGVDNADKMICEYSCQRPTRRWPCKIMFHVTDTAALNAYIMWMQLNPEWNIKNRSRRRIFIREVAEGLITPHITRRSWDSLQMPIMKSMMIFGAKRPATTVIPPSSSAASGSRGKCVSCKRRIRQKCTYCLGFVCDDCSVKLNICPNCQNPETTEDISLEAANVDQELGNIHEMEVEELHEPNHVVLLDQINVSEEVEVEVVFDHTDN